MMRAMSLPVVWSPLTRLHEPMEEVWVGRPAARHRGARAGRPYPGCARRAAPCWRRPRRTTRCCGPCTTPACSPGAATAAERWAAAGYEDLVGQARVVPYLFPTPAMTGGHAGPDPGRWCTPRPGAYCYDTCTLLGTGHLAGGPGGGRLRADRGQTWSPRASARRTHCADRPATT